MKNIFHVHTYRCGHASDESDEEYVKTAISLGATSITFTDHTPLPSDYFENRMKLSQLDQYISSLKLLKEKYKSQINISIGLECEYLPSMHNFFVSLKNNPDIDLLILGQHFYEHQNLTYSFNDPADILNTTEYSGCGNAIIQGMETGLFTVVAHPDRIFKSLSTWPTDANELILKIINKASELNIPLEKNLSSYEKFLQKSKRNFWNPQFWNLLQQYNSTATAPVKIIQGLDAHSTTEMISREKLMDSSLI